MSVISNNRLIIIDQIRLSFLRDFLSERNSKLNHSHDMTQTVLAVVANT